MNSRFGAIFVVLLLASSGCHFRSGPDRLARLQSGRQGVEPLSTTVFRRDPAEGERSLSELEGSLSYWRATNAEGLPRWEGVLSPDPLDLYDRVLARIEAGEESITLVAYRYDSMGLDLLTLVDYVGDDGQRIGEDSVCYGPGSLPVSVRDGPGSLPVRDQQSWPGWSDMAWWEYPQLLLDLPVAVVIGAKEFAGELVKAPFSALYTTFVSRAAIDGYFAFSPAALGSGALAAREDLLDGVAAFCWRFQVRDRHTPLDLLRDLAGALPLVGPVMDHKSPPGLPSQPEAVFLSQGIDAGSETEQFTQSWERALEDASPGIPVVTSPFRYSGLMDVIWSLLNVSSGASYSAAADIVFEYGIEPGQSIDLIAFSGGVQRMLVATRVLRRAGVCVRHFVGIAGPYAGSSCASRTDIILEDNFLVDPVTLSADVTNVVYSLLPPNAAQHRVADAGGHHTPYFPDPRSRQPVRGFEAKFRQVYASMALAPSANTKAAQTSNVSE